LVASATGAVRRAADASLARRGLEQLNFGIRNDVIRTSIVRSEIHGVE
jgi:hypothetical protein